MENVLKGVYNPLSRPLFIYVNRKSADRPEVKEYVEFFLKQGPALVAEVKYLPLPASAYAACQQRFAALQVGTAFGGVAEVGLKIDELMKRTPSTDIKEEKKAEPASAPKK
jgi:phosphate transport system substrate-binding protein